MTIADKIIELIRESVIFQGTITLIILGVWAYLVVTGRPVPQDIYILAGTVVGFFFGGKYQSAVSKAKKDC